MPAQHASHIDQPPHGAPPGERGSTPGEPGSRSGERGSTPSERITAAVTSWPGVTAGRGSRGEFAFTVGRRQIGHLHGDRAAHFSFPKSLWRKLIAQGRVMPHPVFPDAEGPAARRIETGSDEREVISLMRLNYERALASTGRSRGSEGS